MISVTRILDVGCGAGIISEALARLGAEVTAIDACEDNIEAARRHAEADTQGQAWSHLTDNTHHVIFRSPKPLVPLHECGGPRGH